MRYLILSMLAIALCLGSCSNNPTTENGEPLDTDIDTGAAFDPQCFGMDDFTLCERVTDPDLDYDICINGWCHTPGILGDPTGPHFHLADTGQRLCFDDDGVFGSPDGGIPDGGIVPDGGSLCPSEGEAFFGQDAQYGWDTTHEATERFTRDTTTTPDEPTVVDNATGLMWQGCAAGFSGDSCAAGAPHEMEQRDALVYCDTLSWGGHDSWRLPDIYEMYSIISLGSSGSAMDPSTFPGIGVEGLWTSLTPINSEGSYTGSYADLVRAGIYIEYAYSNQGVLCVRRGPLGTRHLEPSTVSGDRVVVDTTTGLEWQGCAAGLGGDECESGETTRMTWRDALTFCEGLSWAGKDDWRLPNAKEAQSITNHILPTWSVEDPAFPNVSMGSIWSSSTDPNDPSSALKPSIFEYGVHLHSKNKLEDLSVICVRK